MVATLFELEIFERCSFMMIIFTSCRPEAGPLISYPEAYPNHHAHKWPIMQEHAQKFTKFLVNEHNIKMHIENHTRSIHTIIIMMNIAWLIHVSIKINIIIIGGST